MARLIAEVAAKRARFWMQDFGHPAKKGTVLVGTAPWIENFQKAPQLPSRSSTTNTKMKHATGTTMGKAKGKAKGHAKAKGQARAKRQATSKGQAKAQPKAAVQLAHCRIVNGKKCVTGKKSYLKASQVYPPKFALAVVMHHWPSKFAE